MFGLRKWEKFRKRILEAKIGLSVHELDRVYGSITEEKIRNKKELIAYYKRIIERAKKEDPPMIPVIQLLIEKIKKLP